MRARTAARPTEQTSFRQFPLRTAPMFASDRASHPGDGASLPAVSASDIPHLLTHEFDASASGSQPLSAVIDRRGWVVGASDHRSEIESDVQHRVWERPLCAISRRWFIAQRRSASSPMRTIARSGLCTRNIPRLHGSRKDRAASQREELPFAREYSGMHEGRRGETSRAAPAGNPACLASQQGVW